MLWYARRLPSIYRLVGSYLMHLVLRMALQGVTNDLLEMLDPEQQALLEQVQNLAPEVIQALPPEERQQIMELRVAMGLPPT
jgi:hypothetical protein